MPSPSTSRLSNKLPGAVKQGRAKVLINSSGPKRPSVTADGHHEDSKSKATTKSETEKSTEELLHSIVGPRPCRPQTVTLSKRSVPLQSQTQTQPQSQPPAKSQRQFRRYLNVPQVSNPGAEPINQRKTTQKHGSPFPENFHLFKDVPFSHRFVPQYQHLRKYPGCVLLNHPVFRPKRGEVRIKFGRAYMHYEKDPIGTLQTQIDFLRKATYITEGHMKEVLQDGAIVKEEFNKRKRSYVTVQDSIKDRKWEVRKLQHEIIEFQDQSERREVKTSAKIPVLDGLLQEKEKLVKRTEELQKVVGKYDDELTFIKCRGSSEEPSALLHRLEASKDIKAKKEILSAALKDEQRCLEVTLQSSNGRIAQCIKELRSLNEGLIEVGIGEYKEGMVKAKEESEI